jgi:hypothetical protein
MVYRGGERSYATMDWQWPHQVALPVMRCLGHNYITLRLFCEPLSLYLRTHSLRRDDQDMIVFRFRQRDHAEQFRNRFGGEFLGPQDRLNGLFLVTRHTDTALDDRQRNGHCVNCAD